MAVRTRSRVSLFSYALSGASGSEGTNAVGRELSSMCSPLASGDVASMVLMRTMVRLKRFSSEPTRADHRAADAPFGERLELDPASLIEPVRGVDQAEDAVLDQIADVDRVRH